MDVLQKEPPQRSEWTMLIYQLKILHVCPWLKKGMPNLEFTWLVISERGWLECFRSTCGGQCWVQTHHIQPWWSTCYRMWSEMSGWSHRSIQSISSLVEQWSWSWWLMEPGQWSPSAYGQQYLGTWWCHQTLPCWRINPYGYQCHTSWCCCSWARGYLLFPYQWSLAGTWILEHGISHCQ